MNIEQIAKLAMLDFTEEEKAMLEKDLPSILEYVSKLQEVDTSNTDAREYLFEMENVFRDDVETVTAEEKQAVIDDFPKKTGSALEVPAVFE